MRNYKSRSRLAFCDTVLSEDDRLTIFYGLIPKNIKTSNIESREKRQIISGTKSQYNIHRMTGYRWMRCLAIWPALAALIAMAVRQLELRH